METSFHKMKSAFLYLFVSSPYFVWLAHEQLSGKFTMQMLVLV